MKLNLMKRCVLLGAAALTVAACFTDKDYSSTRTTQILVRFEPDEDYEWDEFVQDFFNDGKATVSIPENFQLGPIYYFAKLTEDSEFQGGFLLGRGHDADVSPERTPSRYAVCDEKYGSQNTKAYAVFHDTTAFLMPEHGIQIYIPNVDSSCKTSLMHVHNVQAAVQAAKYGVGLADGPFQADDYLTLTVTGLKNSAETGKKVVKLIEGTKIVDEWTEVDLEPLGSVDAVDLHLASSRADFPLYCCIDDMGFIYYEVYK